MNGKYYGQREIRWHSREKDRLKRIHNRKDKNESIRGNRPDLGRNTCSGFGGISDEPLDGASHRTAGWNKRRVVYRHRCRCYGNGLDIKLWR